VTDRRDRGEAGPGVSSGVRERAGERGRAMTGRWQAGPGTQCQVARFKLDLKSNPNSNGSKHFQTVSNFDQLEKYFLGLEKIEIKYGFEDLREMNNFL
jgi:hypothetical protein